MSRIIVKNLPKKTNEKQLKELFSQSGEVTDVKVITAPSGESRRFGFVGFVTEEQAQSAVQHFNQTYIGTSKVVVEVARPYGDQELSRPWSRYSKGSSAYQKRELKKTNAHAQNESPAKAEGKVNKLKQVVEERSKLSATLAEYDELETDPQFQEFLEAQSKTAAWASSGTSAADKVKVKAKSSTVQSVEAGDEEEEEEEEEEGQEGAPEITRDPGTSDMEYLRSKSVKSSVPEEGNKEEGEQDSGVGTCTFTVKMLGLPFTAKEEDIRSFFHPVPVLAVRFTTDPQGRPSGRAYVDVSSEEDLRDALGRNGDCIGRRYIELFRDEGPVSHPGGRGANSASGAEGVARPWEGSEHVDQVEGIAESGRLFLRNLPFTTTEEDLSEAFEKFGPLTEVMIHLDKTTNKSTGLAFVTFMLPEHAVQAYEAMDGQVFQGRLLHVLPALPREKKGGGKKEEEEGGGGEGGSSSYKKKKAAKLKSESTSGHNWNSLFLGTNAVVDAMAKRYNTEKSAILDTESGHSAAVRVALGETQLVSETRDFLMSHGVHLELLDGNSNRKRSNTTFLVKNLPFGTKTSELEEIFSPFGLIGNLVLPPAGVSALVEFTEASHAKAALQRLAYTSFKHLPLFLEWAPVGVLGAPPTATPTNADGAGEPAADDAGSTDPQKTCTVFVKNLNFCTSDDSLMSLFARVGKVKSAKIARKRNMKDPSRPLSMGFGFVEYVSHKEASRAIRELQHVELDSHRLELKLSYHQQHQASKEKTEERKTSSSVKQVSAKVLVRNIPFEATKKELGELFKTFGELKTVRLPRKFGTKSEHRGFGFVEYLTKEDAGRAFEALGHSTHLYGRRLVLEWAQEEGLEEIRKRTSKHFYAQQQSLDKKKIKLDEVFGHHKLKN